MVNGEHVLGHGGFLSDSRRVPAGLMIAEWLTMRLRPAARDLRGNVDRSPGPPDRRLAG